MPKHIGIVAVSPEGSALCYRLIGRRASAVDDPDRRPRITLHNRPFSLYVEALSRGDWETIATFLRESAEVLHHAGADFCVLPDNVAHHALPMAEVRSPLPWLNMIELVADAVVDSGCQRVGLIGTKYVTYGSTYQTLLGLRKVPLLVPNENDAASLDRIIFSEAVYGSLRDESRDTVARSVRALGERGCEAVIIGTSETVLRAAAADAGLLIFDPVELLAEQAVAHAIA